MGALVVISAGGCRAVAPVTPRRGLEVSALEVRFSEPGAGRLRFTVKGAPPRVSSVRWRLWLDGWEFAAGLEGAPSVVPGGLEVETPLVWKHLAWSDGARYLAVRVEGTLQASAGEVAFEGVTDIAVRGYPSRGPLGD